MPADSLVVGDREEATVETIVGTETGSGMLATARRLSAGVAAGLVAGAAIGGVGGRVAMLVLRLTSDPRLHGMQTDDGFTIGIVSRFTLFLIILTMVGGGVGGVAYLGIRSWLPERHRAWLFGSLMGLVGGAAIIKPGGVDFTRIEPLGLAVAMFVALPAAYGVATSLLAERFLREDSAFRGSRASLALLVFLLPIGLLGTYGLVVLVVLVAWLALRPSAPRLAGMWSSAPVTWLGRAALAVVAVGASVELARDVTTVL